MRDLERGTQLAGRYTLVRKLGRGSATESWLATDKMTKADVALKINVTPEAGSDLLRREWQFSIRLVHAHIVRAFEFHDVDDGAFYSQQFIDGPDISVLTGAPFEEVLAPVALIASALEYAHGKNVVHRDIKASNILVDANGAPYLIDFGVAARDAERVGGGSLIAASPQQLDGAAPSPSDDVFALGGLVYELLSGRSPYTAAATATDIQSLVPTPVTTMAGDELPPDVQALVSAMLNKDPAQRPTAGDVVTRLCEAGIQPGPVSTQRLERPRGVSDEVIATETATMRKSGSTPKPATIAKDSADGLNPRVVGTALLVLLLLLIGVIFVLPDSVQREDPAEETVVDEAVPAEVTDAADEEPDALPMRDERVVARNDAEKVLGQLLSKIRTLEGRAVPRWGGLAWKRVDDIYKRGDAEYLAKNYAAAEASYAEALVLVDPLLVEVDKVFASTMTDAELALENADSAEAVRLFDLAVAISPNHGPAKKGLLRAKNLDAVLVLTEQGLAHERDLELDAAAQSFEQAIEIDPLWQVATDGLTRVRGTIRQMQFDARMTEGLTALAERDYRVARAAFRRAQELIPESREPADGLLQVEQEIRLDNISQLESDARAHEAGERWQEAYDTYKRALELDENLTFAHAGVERTGRMKTLHEKLQGYIDEPDSLSVPRTLQTATTLLLDITRMPEIGPRLESQRDELSRLLKRAATPLSVELISDNATDVSIYKVGKLGTFDRTELALRPGTYVAVGSRPGFRDVRLEFRVAPEIDMQPVVVRCEEKI